MRVFFLFKIGHIAYYSYQEIPNIPTMVYIEPLNFTFKVSETVFNYYMEDYVLVLKSTYFGKRTEELQSMITKNGFRELKVDDENYKRFTNYLNDVYNE